MKKTITIPDRLIRPVKLLAVDSGLSFKAYLDKHITESLENLLNIRHNEKTVSRRHRNNRA